MSASQGRHFLIHATKVQTFFHIRKHKAQNLTTINKYTYNVYKN